MRYICSGGKRGSGWVIRRLEQGEKRNLKMCDVYYEDRRRNRSF